MIPYGLQTEQRTEPLGLDDPRPRLSWKLRSDRHGAAQSAYRITATAGGETVWDTGRRESADTILIPWEGAGLRSATRYRWRVEVWDEAGTATAAETWFETGLLHREDWTAVWIGRDPVALPPVDPPTGDDLVSPGPQEAALHLRHEFRLPARPVRARLYATARGVYELYLGGDRVGDRELAPGWTEYHHRPTC
jgi:alpha-L-rhamnosidase